jgi:glycerate dehydrogenase
MKPDSYLVNMARGGIVNEKDLAIALNSNLIAGAATDVYSSEPIKENNPLLNITNPEKIIFTPHIAWASVESRNVLVDEVYRNIEKFIMKKG